MKSDALAAMLYAINPDGTPSPVASSGICNVKRGIVNEPAALDISSIIGIDLSRAHDFYTMIDVNKTITAYAAYIKYLLDDCKNVEELIAKQCPNRRVAYLILHAKKERTRKKNVNRACRINLLNKGE